MGIRGVKKLKYKRIQPNKTRKHRSRSAPADRIKTLAVAGSKMVFPAMLALLGNEPTSHVAMPTTTVAASSSTSQMAPVQSQVNYYSYLVAHVFFPRLIAYMNKRR